MSKARLHDADQGFAPQFGKRGELRQSVGETGRIHLDRWLPFVMLNRSSEPASSIARRVAINSPTYLIWSPQDDQAAKRAFAAVLASMEDQFDSILLMTITDAGWEPPVEGSQDLPPFDLHIAASAGENAQSALDCLAEAMAKIRIDLREPCVTIR